MCVCPITHTHLLITDCIKHFTHMLCHCRPTTTIIFSFRYSNLFLSLLYGCNFLLLTSSNFSFFHFPFLHTYISCCNVLLFAPAVFRALTHTLPCCKPGLLVTCQIFFLFSCGGLKTLLFLFLPPRPCPLFLLAGSGMSHTWQA